VRQEDHFEEFKTSLGKIARLPTRNISKINEK
jgi:hypothetical protein